jgi:hypothetical protein
MVHQQTGGLSLTVLRAVLTKWAVQGISRNERQRRWRHSYVPHFAEDFYRPEPTLSDSPYRVDSYRYEREPYFADEPRLVRPRRNYREHADLVEPWEHAPHNAEASLSDEPLGVSLPINII